MLETDPNHATASSPPRRRVPHMHPIPPGPRVHAIANKILKHVPDAPPTASLSCGTAGSGASMEPAVFEVLGWAWDSREVVRRLC